MVHHDPGRNYCFYIWGWQDNANITNIDQNTQQTTHKSYHIYFPPKDNTVVAMISPTYCTDGLYQHSITMPFTHLETRLKCLPHHPTAKLRRLIPPLSPHLTPPPFWYHPVHHLLTPPQRLLIKYHNNELIYEYQPMEQCHCSATEFQSTSGISYNALLVLVSMNTLTLKMIPRRTVWLILGRIVSMKIQDMPITSQDIGGKKIE